MSPTLAAVSVLVVGVAVGVAQDLVDGVELGLGPGEGGLHRGHSHYNITISALTTGSIDGQVLSGRGTAAEWQPGRVP